MRELFDQVQEAGLRCQGIANNLLAYSRRAPAQLKRVDVNELLERTLTFITRYRKLGGLEVTSDLQTNLPKASVDGAELQQAFTNIIENALHAMDGREPAELELKSRLEDQRIHIEIGDSGPGIRPRRLERIWEPFFTTKANGTGLGLYITKRIIERQRGRVSVTSTPDAGTRFLISLPLS